MLISISSISNKRRTISYINPSIVFNSSKCDEYNICKNICKVNIEVSEKDETDKFDRYLHTNCDCKND